MNIIELPENLPCARKRDPSILTVYMDEGKEFIIEVSEIGDSLWSCRLIIKRVDGEPIRSWRVLQDIKNAVIGSDRYAIEVYPPESFVIDTANTYHLWVFQPGHGPGVGLSNPLRSPSND